MYTFTSKVLIMLPVAINANVIIFVLKKRSNRSKRSECRFVHTPLSPSQSWKGASVSASETSAPSPASSRRWRLRCRCHAVKDRNTGTSVSRVRGEEACLLIKTWSTLSPNVSKCWWRRHWIVSPSLLLPPLHPVAGDKGTSGDLSSFECCCHPSGQQ